MQGARELDGDKFKPLPIGFIGCNQSDVVLRVSHFGDNQLEAIQESGRENQMTYFHMKVSKKLNELLKLVEEHKRNELPNLVMLWAKEFSNIAPDDHNFFSSRSNGFFTKPYLRKSDNGRVYRSRIAIKGKEIRYCMARQCVIYVLHKNLKLTKSKIGRMMDKDHSTIISNLRHVRSMLESGNEMFTGLIGQLYKRIEKHLA